MAVKVSTSKADAFGGYVEDLHPNGTKIDVSDGVLYVRSPQRTVAVYAADKWRDAQITDEQTTNE